MSSKREPAGLFAVVNHACTSASPGGRDVTAGTDRQTARVDVDATTWRAVILAIAADRSVADHLGQLVRDELRRARRRRREQRQGAPTGPTLPARHRSNARERIGSGWLTHHS